MRFVFGSHQHPIGQVFISEDTRERRHSARGRILSVRRRLSIAGTIIASTQSSITAAMDQMVSGYLTEGGAGLLQDNGQPSHHYLPVSGSLSGVQVVSGPSFPATNRNAEYATGRSFTVTLEAEYLYNPQDPLVAYSEVISIQGNGGPKLVVHELDLGPPVVEQTRQRTKVIVRQQGQAIGYRGRVSPNPPLFPEYQSGETPLNVFGSSQVQGRLDRLEYPTQWSYTFELPFFPGARYPLER